MISDLPTNDALKEGVSLYLQPMGVGPGGGGLCLPLAGGPLSFDGLRVILRSGTRRLYDSVFPIASLAALKRQLPARLAPPFEQTLGRLTSPRKAIGAVRYGKPLIMGILNVTPDSFSDGGTFFAPDQALAGARALFEAGADIVDAGAESTRPGAQAISCDEELKRLAPVLDAVRDLPGPVSVDTRKSEVMAVALEKGATLINDVSALTYDQRSLARAKRAPGIVLMHARGLPETMQDNPVYDDVVLDVYDFLSARIAACEAAGIAREKLIVDPGIGFGKTLAHNLDLLRGLSLYQGLGTAVLAGVSRKRFIGALTGEDNPKERLAGSLAAGLFALGQGAQVIRAHDVRETRQALAVFSAWCAKN